jgi:O-antigen/teichoic acid export membrane protein
LRGGPGLVALWAQLNSLIELVASVALAGIGTGLAVLVVQAKHPEQQRWLLRESLKLGLAVSLPVLLLAAALSWRFSEQVAGNGFSPGLLILGAASGWVAIVPGMINNYWLGRQRRDLMLWLALGSAVLPLAASIATPEAYLLALIAISYAAPALVAAFVIEPRGASSSPLPEWRSSRRTLLRFAMPGIVIGLLSPASMVAARSIVSSAMSWQEVGLLQALWRVSDWVGGVAAGILSVYFLPKLTAAFGTQRFHGELKRAALMTIAPAAVAFGLLLDFQRPIIESLYDESFRMSDGTVALFFAGSLARIAAWVPLFALYAMRRTGAIALGEFLSLPLFALLLALCSEWLSLEITGAIWLGSYLIYGVFNFWAATRSR